MSDADFLEFLVYWLCLWDGILNTNCFSSSQDDFLNNSRKVPHTSVR